MHNNNNCDSQYYLVYITPHVKPVLCIHKKFNMNEVNLMKLVEQTEIGKRSKIWKDLKAIIIKNTYHCDQIYS